MRYFSPLNSYLSINAQPRSYSFSGCRVVLETVGEVVVLKVEEKKRGKQVKYALNLPSRPKILDENSSIPQ